MLCYYKLKPCVVSKKNWNTIESKGKFMRCAIAHPVVSEDACVGIKQSRTVSLQPDYGELHLAEGISQSVNCKFSLIENFKTSVSFLCSVPICRRNFHGRTVSFKFIGFAIEFVQEFATIRLTATKPSQNGSFSPWKISLYWRVIELVMRKAIQINQSPCW